MDTKRITQLLLATGLFVTLIPLAQAQTTPAPGTFERGIVEKVAKESEVDMAGSLQKVQTLNVRLVTGPAANSTIQAESINALQKGDRVIIGTTKGTTVPEYYIADRDRTGTLITIALIFFVLTILLGRLKGATSILGLGLSILILATYVMPTIMKGGDPFVTCIIGAFATVLISLYTAHGFNKRTSIALVATLITLTIATGMSLLFVELAHLSGTGSDEATSFQFSNFANINLQGLLLGGIIIGTLGVLDDITTAQVAVVDELRKANPAITLKRLIEQALSVGREHIASLVNTLALAYVGASFPLLLLFTADTDTPLWVAFNSEVIAEEVVRTLAGSISLVLAVPIATLLAAYILSRKKHHA